MLVNCTNLHDQHKVFQVARESCDCTQSIWIIFYSFALFSQREKKKGKVINCGNES